MVVRTFKMLSGGLSFLLLYSATIAGKVSNKELFLQIVIKNIIWKN